MCVRVCVSVWVGGMNNKGSEALHEGHACGDGRSGGSYNGGFGASDFE